MAALLQRMCHRSMLLFFSIGERKRIQHSLEQNVKPSEDFLFKVHMLLNDREKLPRTISRDFSGCSSTPIGKGSTAES